MALRQAEEGSGGPTSTQQCTETAGSGGCDACVCCSVYYALLPASIACCRAFACLPFALASALFPCPTTRLDADDRLASLDYSYTNVSSPHSLWSGSALVCCSPVWLHPSSIRNATHRNPSSYNTRNSPLQPFEGPAGTAIEHSATSYFTLLQAWCCLPAMASRSNGADNVGRASHRTAALSPATSEWQCKCRGPLYLLQPAINGQTDMRTMSTNEQLPLMHVFTFFIVSCRSWPSVIPPITTLRITQLFTKNRQSLHAAYAGT